MYQLSPIILKLLLQCLTSPLGLLKGVGTASSVNLTFSSCEASIKYDTGVPMLAASPVVTGQGRCSKSLSAHTHTLCIAERSAVEGEKGAPDYAAGG